MILDEKVCDGYGYLECERKPISLLIGCCFLCWVCLHLWVGSHSASLLPSVPVVSVWVDGGLRMDAEKRNRADCTDRLRGTDKMPQAELS